MASSTVSSSTSTLSNGVPTAQFTAGGLATGMDTSSMIDQLVKLESQPITDLQSRQSDMKVQVSTLGSIVSALSALDTATADLTQNGALASKVDSTNTAFSATAGTGAVPGRYSVQVKQLASAASWRSDAFGSSDALTAGTLTLSVNGNQYPPAGSAPIQITQGESLANVASDIRASGAPVSAQALTDSSGNTYLSLTNLATGAPLDGSAALAVQFTAASGATGKNLDFGKPTVKDGQNATLQVDGLNFVRSTNQVTDIVPGVTLNLTQTETSAEDVVVSTDTSATQARLQKFVDAYNGAMSLLQSQLSPAQGADRNQTLTGDGAVRSLASQLQRLITTAVPGAGSVSTLASLGLKTAQDGTLSIDTATLGNAIAADPSAVNAIFSTSTTGLGALVDALVQNETQPGTGLLIQDQANLNKSSQNLTDQITTLQAHVDSYKQNLQSEFTAMENTVSQLKNIGNYLTNQFSSSSSSTG